MDSTTTDDRLDALERRLAALELSEDPRSRSNASGPPTSDVYWALNGVRDRYNGTGGVMYTGLAELPSGDHAEWQRESSVDSLLEGSWELAADRLAALGHPARLCLLQAVLDGRQTTGELAELEEMGSTGQVHHHLRQLTTAGWLRSSGRGRYEVPTPALIPLLAIITASLP